MDLIAVFASNPSCCTKITTPGAQALIIGGHMSSVSSACDSNFKRPKMPGAISLKEDDMYINYTHKASGPKTEGHSVDLSYLLQRKSHLEQNIKELDAQIAVCTEAIVGNALITQGKDIEAQIENTLEHVEQGSQKILEDTSEREAIHVNLQLTAQRRSQLLKLIEQTEEGITKLLSELEGHRTDLKKVSAEISRLEQELKSEERRRQASAKALVDKGSDMTQTLVRQLKHLKKEFHSQTHKPAKRSRELTRKRDKLQRRLEALKQDIAHYQQRDAKKVQA